MAKKPSRHKQKRLIVKEILGEGAKQMDDLEKLEAIMIGQAERIADNEDRLDALEKLVLAKIKLIDELQNGLMSLCVAFSEVIAETENSGKLN